MSKDISITLKNVEKAFYYEGKYSPVLDGLNLEIFHGEFFVFVGPSGCGKSTMLQIMSGLEGDYKGEIVFDSGISRGDISFVFQQFALFPWLRVFENIALPLIARGVSARDQKQKVQEELEKFGLEGFALHYPKELSGGMRQRVGIARALITNPKVIFMDEPFSELDSFTAEELRKELLHIWERLHVTIVMVTHLVSEAIELADRIAVLSARPAKIERIIKNSLSRPREKRSEDFYHLEDEITKLIKP